MPASLSNAEAQAPNDEGQDVLVFQAGAARLLLLPPGILVWQSATLVFVQPGSLPAWSALVSFCWLTLRVAQLVLARAFITDTHLITDSLLGVECLRLREVEAWEVSRTGTVSLRMRGYDEPDRVYARMFGDPGAFVRALALRIPVAIGAPARPGIVPVLDALALSVGILGIALAREPALDWKALSLAALAWTCLTPIALWRRWATTLPGRNPSLKPFGWQSLVWIALGLRIIDPRGISGSELGMLAVLPVLWVIQGFADDLRSRRSLAA